MDKALSPVLNKRNNYSRRVLLNKKTIIKNVNEKKVLKKEEVKSVKNLEGKTKITENAFSLIPVPIRDTNELKQQSLSSLKHSSEEPSLATPSAVLDFKNEILAKCAGFVSEHRPSSGSEGKIKKCSEGSVIDTLNSVSEDGSSKENHFKRDISRNSSPMGKKVETTQGSGDIRGNEGCLNMLYENKAFKFNPLSITSVDKTSDSYNQYQSNTCSSLDSVNVDVNHDDDDLFDDEEFIERNVSTSQLNYNIITTDESNTKTGNNKVAVKPKEDFDLCTQETNLFFANISQNMENIEKSYKENISVKAGECSSKSTIHVNVTNSILKIKSKDDLFDRDFEGYTEDEITTFQNYHARYKHAVNEYVSENNVKVKDRKKAKKYSKYSEIKNHNNVHNVDKLAELYNKERADSPNKRLVAENENIQSNLKFDKSSQKNDHVSYESSSNAENQLTVLANKLNYNVANCHIAINVRADRIESNNNELNEKPKESKFKHNKENRNIRDTSFFNSLFTRSPEKPVDISKKTLENTHKVLINTNDCATKENSNNHEPTIEKNKYDTNNEVKNFQVEASTSSNVSGFKFVSGSGKPIQVSKKYLEKAKEKAHKLFQGDLTDDSQKNDLENSYSKDEKLAGGSRRSLQFSDTSAVKQIEKQSHLNKTDKSNLVVKSCGFSSASGESINISSEKLKEAANRLSEPNDKTNEKNHIQKNYKRDRENYISSEKLRKAADLVAEVNDQSNEEIQILKKFKPDTNDNGKLCGFSKASGKPINISSEKLRKAANLYAELDDQPNIEKNVSKKYNHDRNDNEKTTTELIEDAFQSYNSAMEKFHSSPTFKINKPTKPMKNMLTRTLSSKKKFEMRKSKPITISEDKLENAKLLFADIELENESSHFNRTNSPLRTNHFLNNIENKNRNTSTLNSAKKSSEYTSTPNSKLPAYNMSFNDLTPIKDNNKNMEYLSDSTVFFHEKSCSNFEQWQNDNEKEYNALKKKLELLEERMVAVSNQKNLLNRKEDQLRQKTGVLTKNKQKDDEQRVPLKNLCFYNDKNIDDFNIDKHIFEVTPKNAEDIHFNVDGVDKAVITTLDGATVIPTTRNTVGLTEIENAFRAMEGVDPKLIPQFWVQNHYKWIVWKLASYDRKFPQYFKNCLSIENIIQQLKYRYEREIDNAQRPALRKIFEKDDIPQKRLVLCVSDIIQLYTNKFELQLTDGWYEIRASIDAPLCQQIYRGRIKVGTKLIMHGAELVNCRDGHHPLQAPDDIRLKITYNSTRRADWHVKLGYYKNPSPFPIELKTIHKDGGLIGMLKVYVVRVYPKKYVEDHNGVKIWRNGKAEDKHCLEVEAESKKLLDTIRQEAISEYEQENKKKELNDNAVTNVKNIDCGKTLLNLIEKSYDPDKLFSSLTSSQQKSLVEYQQNATLQRQSDISHRISLKAEEKKVSKRNVTPVLKMCVNDVTNCDTSYTLNFWKPSDEDVEMLKEGSSYNFYNLNIRKSGELSTTKRTFYEENPTPPVFKKLHRQLLPIAMTNDTYYKPLFNEFDTVGMVVQTKINKYDQELWLCDFLERLLCVRISYGPQFCCLLGNLKRGQTVALSNLVMQTPHAEYGRALATLCSVISQYPKQTLLRGGLEIFNQQLPEDLDKMLLNCDGKIDQILKQIEEKGIDKNTIIKQSTSSYYNYLLCDSMEDVMSLPSKLTDTDVAMSLIDTDQFS